MKLNIENLMIGDWVMIKDYPMISEPLKMTENHFVRSLCEFEAIPLTKKFLMDNGFTFFPVEPIYGYGVFELKTEHCLLRYSNKHCDIQIFKARQGGIDPESNNCVQRNDRYEINCGQFLIKYIHELQHILKLCNIELDLKFDDKIQDLKIPKKNSSDEPTDGAYKMITADILIKNGFKFRQYEGSKLHEGEYVKQTPQYRIELGYADLFDWNINISKWANCIKFSMSNLVSPTINKINAILETCEIDFKIE